MKPIVDGSKVVGLINRQYSTQEMSVNLPQIEITGAANVRDLWRKKTLGIFNGTFSTYVPSHGVVIVKIKSKLAKGAPVCTSARFSLCAPVFTGSVGISIYTRFAMPDRNLRGEPDRAGFTVKYYSRLRARCSRSVNG